MTKDTTQSIASIFQKKTADMYTHAINELSDLVHLFSCNPVADFEESIELLEAALLFSYNPVEALHQQQDYEDLFMNYLSPVRMSVPVYSNQSATLRLY
jgi:hypothetical protein